MMNTRNFPYLMSAILAVVCIGTACDREESCEVPAGEYETRYSAIRGDCEPQLIANVDGKVESFTVNPGTQCQRMTRSLELPLDGDCRASIDVSARTTSEGIIDGVNTFTFICDHQVVCRHEFRVTYTRRSAP